MKRRKLIATGSLGIASLAGCIYILNQRRDSSDDDEISPPSEDRVHEPEHEINRPEDEDEWNPHYLGENQSNNPSIEFNQQFNARLIDEKLSVTNMEVGNEFLIRVIDNESDMNDIIRTDENVDFNSEKLLVVESGYGSSSYMHRWSRIEETNEGVHLYGYLYRPIEKRNDLDSNSSIIKINSNIENLKAKVSLTMDADFQVNFNSEENIVRIPFIT